MIIVDDVFKSYVNEHGARKWVLQGVNLTIPAACSVGLVGCNGAGKSTLLRIIGGTDQPTRGQVIRQSRVSFPLGLAGGLQSAFSGRQNAKFVCRVMGREEGMKEILEGICDYAELGPLFDEPVRTYSSGMQARLRFAISLAFDFDVYIIDEMTAVGDARFTQKSKDTFRGLADRAGLIMVSHSDKTLREFCEAGIWLHQGRAHWFDKLEDALENYRKSINA